VLIILNAPSANRDTRYTLDDFLQMTSHPPTSPSSGEKTNTSVSNAMNVGVSKKVVVPKKRKSRKL
jgi:hypothetical protein